MKRMWMIFFAVVLGLAPLMMAQAPMASQNETGLAAVYSSRLNGHVTASGQKYNPSALTAAHKTLPYGTKIKVTNTKNDKSVVLRVNDRGPVQTGRVLDITPAAAARLGIPKKGMRDVTVAVVETGDGKTTRQHAE